MAKSHKPVPKEKMPNIITIYLFPKTFKRCGKVAKFSIETKIPDKKKLNDKNNLILFKELES